MEETVMKRKPTFFITSLFLAASIILGLAPGDEKHDSKSITSAKRHIIQSVKVEYGPPLSSPLSALNESFENATFPPAGWTKINVAPNSTGWNRQLVGTTPVPGFNGGVITSPPGGGNAVAFCNYETGGSSSNDQWLITPQLTNIQANDSLRFWLRKFGDYLDHMHIKISTTTPTVAAMTIIIDTLTFQPSDSGWIYYSYRIGSLVPSGSNIYIGFRQWVLNALNDGASFSLDLVSVTGLVGVSGKNNESPASYELSQNYPNPFNPSTVIGYSIPEAGNIRLSVYDVLGKEVRVLLDEFRKAGNYEVSFDASDLAAGVYFYRIQAGMFRDTKKMILVK
jgi:hypothetical protein